MLTPVAAATPTRSRDALAHSGQIFKTLHVLAYVDAESYRRAMAPDEAQYSRSYGQGSGSRAVAH
jgi:hypothetical protein